MSTVLKPNFTLPDLIDSSQEWPEVQAAIKTENHFIRDSIYHEDLDSALPAYQENLSRIIGLIEEVEEAYSEMTVELTHPDVGAMLELRMALRALLIKVLGVGDTLDVKLKLARQLASQPAPIVRIEGYQSTEELKPSAQKKSQGKILQFSRP